MVTSDPVTSGKELETHSMAPVSIHMYLKKNKDGRANQSCPICNKMEEMKKVEEPVSNYGLSPNIKFIDDPTSLLESEIHEGKPKFLSIGKNDECKIRILVANIHLVQIRSLLKGS